MTNRLQYGFALALLLCAGVLYAEEATKPALFDAVLVSEGDSKIQAVKVVRECNGMGLADALNLVKSIPKTVKAGVTKEEGEKIIKVFEPNHAKVELRDAKNAVVTKSAEAPVVSGKFAVVLKTVKNKIQAIVIAREMTGLGLADAKKLVESAPVTLKDGLTKDEAEKFKRKLEAVESEAEVKESGK